MKRSLLVLGLIVLVLCALVALPFTAAGSRWLIGYLDGLGPLRVSYASGSLLGELQLDELAVDVGDVQVRLENIEFSLDRSCLWRSEFCFRYLRVASLSVDVAEGEDAAEVDEPGADSYIEMPYALVGRDVAVGSLRVTWPGGSWEQGALRGSATWRGALLQVPGASLESARLWVEAGEESQSGVAAQAGYEGFDPPRVFLPLKLDVDEVALARLELDLAGWREQVTGIAGAARWRGTKLTVAELTGQFGADNAPLLRDLYIDGSLDFDQQWPLAMTIDAALAVQGLPPMLAERPLRLAVTGDFQDLRGELRSTAGEPGLAVDAQVSILSAGLPFSASGSARWPESTALGAVVDGLPERLAQMQLTAPLAVTVTGDLDAQTLSMEARGQLPAYPDLRLLADATLRAPVLEIRELSLRDAAGDSTVSFAGGARIETPFTLTGTLSVPSLTLPELAALGTGQVAGQARLDLSTGEAGWQGRLTAVDLHGEINGMPAVLRGEAGLASGLQLLPADLRGELNGAQLRLVAGDPDGAPDALDLVVDDFGRWVSGGRGHLEVQARGDFMRGRAKLAGTASEIHLGELRLPAASLDGDLGAADGRLQLDFQVPELVYAGRRLQEVSLALDGSTADHTLRLASTGAVSGALEVRGAAREGGWDATLAPTQLSTNSGAWSLPEPVAIAWRDEQLEVAPHCWQHPDFELCARRIQAGVAGDVQLQLSGQVAAFNGLLPPDMRVAGELGAQLQASWSADSPLRLNAELGAQQTDITRLYGMGESVTVHWDAARLSAVRESGPLDLRGAIERDGRDVLTLRATLPAGADGDIDADLRLDRLQLATFSPWATLFSELGGELSGTLEVSGAVRAPVLTGRAQLARGHALIEGNPTALTDLDLELALQADGGTLHGRGLLGGGELRIDGRITRQPDYRLDMTLAGEKQQLLVPPSSELRVSEKLQLSLTRDLLDVRGEVTVLDGILRHEELPEGSVALSRDVVQVDPAGNPIREERPFDIRADLWIHIDNRFEVRGSNLLATLGGDLHLVQADDAPLQVFGGLSLLGGELRAYRQQLEIKRGTVDFSGPPQNPQLDVSAERHVRSDNVTVGAHLYGTLDEPELEIYSDPPMSQGEAMSYLVRGRGLDTGAGADGAALALAVGADVVNQSGVVRELNRLPLLNNVAFGSSGEEDDTAATLSGYIGDRIYLSYGIGLYEPINEFTARLYLQSRLWLEVVSRLENSVDLYYSFEID
ncbi:hypothetical protein E4634_19290 [Mangrovimicrobium sediminis]|uniref:Translocation and assembly module TamB C-terminal domain-containing protein n=1 Tax=Mangrovimicrobium sediminis TaxID=2562682 RepID=A0A4Z0LW83_9GAMM|nr:translocation/assembly module TamB domain-containing protein [Haliea sp. SAOS-164]TGD71416.1 hypothetical protein E4634_19290 [Haliea sp. SAOS-164]